MAIDRNIIRWMNGEFEGKSYIEILNMLIENKKAIIGSDLDLGADTAEGELLRAQAQIYYDFSLLGLDVFNSFDINNAQGSLLDNLVFLAGNIVRHRNVKSKINCDLSFDGSSLTYDEEEDMVILTDSLGIMWRVKDSEGSGTLSSPARVTLECLYDGENVLDANSDFISIYKNNTFHTNSNIRIDNVNIVTRGSLEESDAQLRARKKESLQYNSINLIDSIRGEVLDNIHAIADIKIINGNRTDPGQNYLTIPLRGIEADPSGAPGNPDADKALNANKANELRLPLHYILVIIKESLGFTIEEGGPNSIALANILKDNITLGISTYQANISSDYYFKEELIINESHENYKETYKYYVARKHNPKITVNLIKREGYDTAASDIESRIRTALYNLSLDYPIGKDINVSELINTTFNQNLDISNPTFLVGSIVVEDDDYKVLNGYWQLDKDTLNTNIEINAT